MSTNPNHLFADDMWGIEHAKLTAEEKAILTADYTPADRNEWFGGCPCGDGNGVCSCGLFDAKPAQAAILNAVQGRPEQAWPVRRCSPEMAVYDPTEDDDASREELTPAEAALLCVIYIVSTLLVLWILLQLAKAWS